MIRNSGWILLPGAAVLLFLSAFPGAASAQTRVSFVARRDFTAGYDPMSVAVGDFNGDGKLDLAVANGGDLSSGAGGNVTVLLGNGDGTFQTAVAFAADDIPQSVAVGDFNGDGKLDLATADWTCFSEGSCGEGNVSILLGMVTALFNLPSVMVSALLVRVR